MKRWICLCCVVAVLATLCIGCKNSKDPDTGEKIYTSFPTSLSVEKIGTLPQACSAADGGLYYRIGQKYGIMSFDGTYNSGAGSYGNYRSSTPDSNVSWHARYISFTSSSISQGSSYRFYGSFVRPVRDAD